MSNLRIYIIEDEELYADQLMILVDELGYELVGMADNSDTAKKEIEEKKPDLLLVDIKINGSMNGIDLVSSIHENQPVPVIFISSFTDKETFKRAKTVNPYAYLTKPFDADNLQRTIELAFNAHTGNEQNTEDSWNGDVGVKDAFFIKNRHRLIKVQVDEILYLEVEDRYSTIYTEEGKKYVLRMSMGSVQEKLPSNNFYRVHRKYTANLTKVSSIDLQDNLLYMGENAIPISRSSKEELLKRLDWLQ